MTLLADCLDCRAQLLRLLAVVLLLFGSVQTAPAGGVSTMVVTRLSEKGALGRHLSHDAVTIGTRYRLVVTPADGSPLTVDAVSPTGETKRLFAATQAPAGRAIQLPQDDGWYAISAAGDVRLIVTQGELRTEHVLRAIDAAALPAETAAGLTSASQRADATVAGADLVRNRNIDALGEISPYRTAALALSSAAEPNLRGGTGAKVFREGARGVVLIVTDKGIGSGVLLSAQGDVLTNWHVIADARTIGVILKPPVWQRLRPTEVHAGRMMKYDQVADLALVRIERPPGDLAPLKLAAEGGLDVGDSVHAIGHPEGEYWTYTQGIVSQIRVGYRWTGSDKTDHAATVIQTQTPVNFGNSGGPLLDDNANVVGIISFFVSDRQGYNFAVALDDIKRFLASSGNRDVKPMPDHPRIAPAGECKPQFFAPVEDAKTKTRIMPVDQLCRGRPNAYYVYGARRDRPERVYFDLVGDGKYDAQVIFEFEPDVDLYIFYGRRDGVPTEFGYDYGRKGNPRQRIVVLPHQ
jgi:S1-C subfamily serine protease